MLWDLRTWEVSGTTGGMEDKTAPKVPRALRLDEGNRVRALRVALGWTQEQLGERVGKARVDVVHLEKGRGGLVNHDARVRFAAGVGLPVPVLDGYLAGEVSLDVATATAREFIAGRAA